MDPLPVRLGRWLLERFPPAAYTLLVGLFWASAIVVTLRLMGDGRWAPTAAVVVWLFFLHLRIFDEHKDFEQDRVAYPERVLSRGEVSLKQLAVVGAVALFLQAALSAWLGPAAFAAWLAAVLFSVAMRFEFGVGGFLRHHIVLYAITHNPVVALLALYLHMASTGGFDPGFVPYILMVSFGSLAFELGRKIRRPEEEHAGVPSYTTELGQTGARGLLAATYALTGLTAAATLHGIGVGVPGSVLGGAGVAVAGIVSCLGAQPAKRVEAVASLVLFACFAVTGVAAWMA